MHTHTSTCFILPLNSREWRPLNARLLMMKVGRKLSAARMRCLYKKIIKTFSKWVFTLVHDSPLECGVCMGIRYYVLLPLELFTNAMAGRGRPVRALFHASARNVVNISSGNICHRSPPTLSHTCMHGQTQTFLGVSEPELTCHTAAEGNEGAFMWNKEHIHSM